MTKVVGGTDELDAKQAAAAAATGKGSYTAEEVEMARQMGQEPDALFGKTKKDA